VCVVAALWPAGLRDKQFYYDFKYLVRYPFHPTLVGNLIFERTPRTAAFYWLSHLDAPILASSALVILLTLARTFRERQFSSKHIYILISLAFYLAVALVSYIAGARNLLPVVGVTCLTTGVFFDEALGRRSRLVLYGSVVVVLLAALNLTVLSRDNSYTPSLATNGYRAFVKQNESRLGEGVTAVVYGTPVLKMYAQQLGTSIDWSIRELHWSTISPPIADEVKYVLMPAFVYEYMPADQPMRRVVAAHWHLAWSHKANDAWELRLYERPQPAAP
jgi:hypothetical protein